MGGLSVLAIIVAYVAIACTIVWLARPRIWKLVAALVTLLVPTADATLGRVYLSHLCSTEGGLKVYRVVENVDGLLVEGATDGHLVKAYGYRFVEGRRAGRSTVDRFEKIDGELKVFTDVSSISSYRRRLVIDDQRVAFPRTRDVVEVIDSGEVLAESTQISFKGGWIERFLGQFSDAGAGSVAWCDLPRGYDLLVLASLKPRER